MLDSRNLFLSFLSDPEDIPIVAEIFNRTRTSPDWLIEFIGSNELDDPRVLDPICATIEIIAPNQGACLVVVGPDSESAREKVPEPLVAVTAGFESSKLQPYIDACLRLNEASGTYRPETT